MACPPDPLARLRNRWKDNVTELLCFGNIWTDVKFKPDGNLAPRRSACLESPGLIQKLKACSTTGQKPLAGDRELQSGPPKLGGLHKLPSPGPSAHKKVLWHTARRAQTGAGRVEVLSVAKAKVGLNIPQLTKMEG